MKTQWNMPPFEFRSLSVLLLLVNAKHGDSYADGEWRCEEFCILYRPAEQHKSYVITCSEALARRLDDDLLTTCEQNCVRCPKICVPNGFIFHCPGEYADVDVDETKNRTGAEGGRNLPQGRSDNPGSKTKKEAPTPAWFPIVIICGSVLLLLCCTFGGIFIFMCLRKKRQRNQVGTEVGSPGRVSQRER